MKPSAAPQRTVQDDSSEHDDDSDTEPTPYAVPSRVFGTELPSPARPQLLRSPPGDTPSTEQTPAHPDRLQTIASDVLGTGDGAGNDHPVLRPSPGGGASPSGGSKAGRGSQVTTEHGSLAELKDALNARMMAQSRGKRSHGPSTGTSSDTKRVSPIQEEEGAQPVPSLATVLGGQGGPVRTTSTVSTESTGSNRTIRGSAHPTPANAPPRTPSYPFPYVSGSPRWPQQFSAGGHQPFTALSPTTPRQPKEDHDMHGRGSVEIQSGDSTPAANSMFAPAGNDVQTPEDPRYPTPNLYDLVLQLNSEPGLEQWWATVTNILHDHFKAERATIVQPVDPTDIENVPWGQRATFSMNGPEEFVSHRTVVEQAAQSRLRRPEVVLREPSTDPSDHGPQRLHPERLKPRLETRHSYAGHGREVKEILGTLNDPAMRPNTRPKGPQRTVTHAAGMAMGISPGRLPPKRLYSGSTMRHGSLSDQDFSSVAGGIDAGPYADVFETLRALNHEVRPLIETGGVCRVLERGRVVAVTRDYSSDPNRTTVSQSAPTPTTSSQSGKLFGNYRSVFTSDNAPESGRDYEEYEQHPSSPWAQSPAPSPAIQSDEENNPFFASDESHVDDSFDPAVSPKDYSLFGQVDAIGVDNANTVLHIPLVHPTLSQPMQSLRMTARPKEQPDKLRRSNTVDLQRKAPIAILSILTTTVPYPSNLTHTLKLLGPHMATSFATAQQFSSTHTRTVSIRHRRTASGHEPSNAPMTIEPASLDDIVNAEFEQPPGSVSGSITSPSEYSGRSRASPSGSIVGTPGWDPAAHGWTASRSVAGTPAFSASEMVDNYFEAKKRAGTRAPSNASTTATPAKGARRNSPVDSKQPASIEEETRSPRSEHKTMGSPSTQHETSPVRAPARDQSPGPIPEAPPRSARPSVSAFPELSKEAKPHSVLHSYGADFLSSFGIASTPTPGEVRTPAAGAHVRKGSYPEDMPPPSERLLRTIIDSVPVQIFTAQPETGSLSWVNSKFLIYRGQEARQVLLDPWSAIHPEDRGEFLPAWHRSLRTNQQLQQKVRLQRFDGSYRWFYVRAAPLKDKRQHVVHWIGTMMDFHEQQLAEINSARQAETAASEAKYRALANSSPQIVFAVNRSTGVTFCNTQWLHYSGQSEAQALGVGFMDHVHPDDLAKCRLPTFDEGSDRPTNVPTSVPPEPKRTVSQSANSSDSSETERGGPGSDDVSMSPISEKPPQRQLSELATTGILKVSRDADGRPSYSTEVRLKSKDGNFRWHLVRVLLADPLLHNEEETWYGTCTDINDHKTLERDLKETMDEKSRFLSNMSHEIRTPLNGITGMVNFLIDSSLTAEQMEHVSIIRASTEGLRGLINDILDLSKAEAGMIQLNMDWLYVRALIEEVNDLTSAMAIDKGLELNYIVDEDVPAQMKGDRFRIRQILLNVIGNAIKFTQKGEVFVRCCLQEGNGELAKNEAYIRFEIVDTGRGFTDKEAEYLFKRFSQIDGSSTRQHGGTGLGLVISRQLAQLHGGDMSAKGIPEQGSTFAFFIKTSVPSVHDQPPPPTPGASSLPVIPLSPALVATPYTSSSLSRISSITSAEGHPKPSLKFLQEVSQSPTPYTVSSDPGRDSPSVSSASSDPSVRSAARTGSLRSERSSASSIVPDPNASPIKLVLPQSEPSAPSARSSLSAASGEIAKGSLAPAGAMLTPPMFSILVVAPLKYSREATVQHIDKTLPKNIPHQITARESFSECQSLLGGNAPVIFTHVVAVLQDVDEIIALMDQVLWSKVSTTAVVLITDLAQRRKIMEQAPKFNYDQLVADRRLRFVFKPLKPSRFGLIFDPQKEREMSLDRNQDSAQQVAVNQKQVFEELTKRLGNKDKRVLLVEDNRINQIVILKFLAKVSIKVDTVLDGVQCTDKVFANPPGYYSIILCDLHMPNKDGYQTCKEIRKWEKKNKHPHLPIVALSANVLGDVYQKCVEAGFNSYMTKPVDFKELSTLLVAFMDPLDPSKPHEFMKLKRGQAPSNLTPLVRH